MSCAEASVNIRETDHVAAVNNTAAVSNINSAAVSNGLYSEILIPKAIDPSI